jgi:mitochondrial fission protein ELM1
VAMAALKSGRAAATRTTTVQIQLPASKYSLHLIGGCFDFVFTPLHDYYEHHGENVYFTKRGGLSRLEMDGGDGPRRRSDKKTVAILVGAPTKTCRYTLDDLESEIRAATSGDTGGENIVVTTSRRTPPSWVDCLSSRLPHAKVSAPENCAIAALLAQCDAVVVTADSVTMITEIFNCAALAGKGKTIVLAKHARGKLERFIRSVLAGDGDDGGSGEDALVTAANTIIMKQERHRAIQ